MKTKTEFAVNMTCQSCVDSVQSALSAVPEIGTVDISLEDQQVVVTGNAAPSAVRRALLRTGLHVIVRGQSSAAGTHLGAAVCILHPTGPARALYGDKELRGLVRFVQADEETCLVDVTVDGLSAGLHGIHIGASGNLSGDGTDTGPCFDNSDPPASRGKRTGDLGNIEVSADDGVGALVLESSAIKVWDIIGRSVVITQGADDLDGGSHDGGNANQKILTGVIARSAGVFQNPKTICACDGTTLWQEAAANKSAM
ncbi:copper chaperone for superoxide dismutase-like protein [Ramicandelaber brevisporus]|nr:copper chaperone for superoxide dismutase-like protein [Ramicandelaber brevisporus]KAI8867566.1 copper chaperone for superoxide dismutase-like protein [Ramicandelaber brevisporus]